MKPAALFVVFVFVFVFVFFTSVTLSVAQKRKIIHRPEWDLRNEADKVSSRGCSNLTLVLDNWKFAIMTQVKDLLLHDHNTVLPDYARIQHLSDALADLYREFNAMKERLVTLTAKFDGVEAFVDDARSGRELRPAGAPLSGAGAGGRPHGRRRSRVVIRKITKPAA